MGYNYNMTIHKLLLLETEANNAMRNIEKEQAYVAKKADEELQVRLSYVEQEKDEKIFNFSQALERETAESIAKIQAEYDLKESTLLSAFAHNRNRWNDNIVEKVLAFESK